MPVSTAYEAWMQGEGIPIVTGHGVEDVREVARGPWPRTGGRGAFLHLDGMEGFTGMYVVEIPAGAALKVQKHLYQALIYVLEGRGATEVWFPGDEGNKATFEWQADSLFGIPVNCNYRMYNGSSTPALYLVATDAPMVMDIFHSDAFVFDCDFRFTDRFAPEPAYYQIDQRQGLDYQTVWDTNLIANASETLVDSQERKGAGVKITAFAMAGYSLGGHLAEWPVGRYHKAHYHQGGAILVILRSHGYSLLWPLEFGPRPYESGHGDSVVRVDWRPGAVFSPPSKWFHQHFNTGPEPARQLALRWHSPRHPAGFSRSASLSTADRFGGYVSLREGGTMIEYEDEDPCIRRDYEAELARRGVVCTMPPAAAG